MILTSPERLHNQASHHPPLLSNKGIDVIYLIEGFVIISYKSIQANLVGWADRTHDSENKDFQLEILQATDMRWKLYARLFLL